MGAILAAFGGSLPPGVTGTNDRCTLLVTNFDPEVSPLVLLGFLPIPFKLYLIIWNYILLQKIDEDKLFNLFSIYGNIVRIKLLRNKPDHALIQMGDGFQAELAVHFLKVCFLLIFLAILFFNCYLFGEKKRKEKGYIYAPKKFLQLIPLSLCWYLQKISSIWNIFMWSLFYCCKLASQQPRDTCSIIICLHNLGEFNNYLMDSYPASSEV